MKKTHAAAGALTLAAGILSVVLGTAASATPGCVPDVRSDTSGVTLTAGGTATPTAAGLQLKTPAQPDAVVWKQTLAAPVPLGNLAQLSYRTHRDPASTAPAVLPALRLYVEGLDGNATGAAVLMFEPYYQAGVGNPASGVWKTWDARAGKWWASAGFAGYAPTTTAGAYADNVTLATVAAANPAAKIVAYGVSLGTWNHDTTATVNEVRFKSYGTCRTTTWTAPAASSSSASASASASSGSPSASATGSASASSSASASATASASASTSPLPSDDPLITSPTGKLPRTGSNTIPLIAGVGGSLLLAGGAILGVLWLRRRPEFEIN